MCEAFQAEPKLVLVTFQNNHPIDIVSNKYLTQKVDYIHYNPVEARIVKEPQNYIYSSANSLLGLKLEAL